MNGLFGRRIHWLTLLSVAMLAFFAIAPNALADDDVMQGSSIPGGETVENDVVLNGTEVTLSGTVVGDALIVGRTIVINGDVEGSMVILGENVIMNGQAEGSVYAIAVSFSHLSEAVINRSLYFLGVSLITEETSAIDRDLAAVTLGVRRAGEVGRNEKILAGIEIGRFILERINAATTGTTFSQSASEAEAILLQSQMMGMELFAGSAGPAPSSPRAQPNQEETTGSNALGNWLINRLRDMVTLLLVGGLLIWLFPGQLDQWASILRKRPLAAGGWGLVTYITGFAGVLILFLLILVVGISLATVTLWDLAWAWWAVGLFALLLAFSLFLVAIAFVSKIIVAYLIGELLFERFVSKPNMRKPWPLLVGLIIYVLLSGIPYLGLAVALVATFLGLGSLWIAFTRRNEAQRNMAEPAANV